MNTVGIYRSEERAFGFFTPGGEYLSPMSRSKARELAREHKVSATSQGIFVPEIGDAVNPTEGKRRYVKYGFGSLAYGTLMFETTDKGNATRFYMAAYMYRRKHPEYNFARILIPGDKKTETRIVFVSL